MDDYEMQRAHEEMIAREKEADERERAMSGTFFDAILRSAAERHATALLEGEKGSERWTALVNQIHVGFKNVVCYADVPEPGAVTNGR